MATHVKIVVDGQRKHAFSNNETTKFLRGDGIFASPPGGGGSPPTGTGFRHVTDGTEDAASKLVDTSDINNDVVTYAKLQNVTATDKLLGRSSGGAGDVEEITCTAFARTVLDDGDAGTFRATIGAGTSSFSGAYGDLSGIPSTFAPLAHATNHQSGGSDAIKLDDLAAGDDNTDLNATTLKHGLLPKLGGGASNFLRADGSWAAPTAAAADLDIPETGTRTVATAKYHMTGARYQLTGVQRLTIAGTGRLRIQN